VAAKVTNLTIAAELGRWGMGEGFKGVINQVDEGWGSLGTLALALALTP
jgi:hypothetical protein